MAGALAAVDFQTGTSQGAGVKDRMLLIGWLLAVIAITFIHEPLYLAALTALVLSLQGRAAPRIALRALAAVVFVNLAVSVAFVFSAWMNGEPWGVFVLRLNLRVFLLALITLWMVRRVDLVRAAAFSPSLQFLLVLVLGQIRTLGAMLVDYRLALTSRSATRPALNVRMRSAGSQVGAMMEKAERNADQLNQGMRARGFFDDRA